MSNVRNEVVQNVVDRIVAYQDGAPAGTVEHELREGLGEVDVEVSDAEVATLVAAIESADGRVDVAGTL